MSEQEEPQSFIPPLPFRSLKDLTDIWVDHWRRQNQPWRTKKEIDVERQQYLAKRRCIVPKIEQGIYPFKGVKLNRADVEWLLATHDDGHGPVDWNDEEQRERWGLDLRGADLRKIDLSELPLTRLRGGLTFSEWNNATREQQTMASVLMGGANLTGTQLIGAEITGAHLKGSILYGAQLEGAKLYMAQLQGAHLQGAQLEGAKLYMAQLQGAHLQKTQLKGVDLSKAQLGGADLREAQLERADLSKAQLQGAHLQRAQLEGAKLYMAQLEGADLGEAQLQGASLYGAQLRSAHLKRAQLEGADLGEAKLVEADLSEANLKGCYLQRTHFEGANLYIAQMEGVNLIEAKLQGANLYGAQLQGACLKEARLQRADLSEAQLEGADLSGAQLEGADLRGAQLEGANLRDIKLSNEWNIGPRIADVRWGDTNLIVADWSQIIKLGDEWVAEQKKKPDGRKKERDTRLNEYRTAVRANRQLVVALQGQGLNEESDNFAYRARSLQRKVYWHQQNLGRWLFSILLALLSGYGYRIWRILAAYIVVVSMFAITYYALGLHYQPQLAMPQAFLVSMTAFHGRVFFEQFSLNTPQIWFTAFEAVAGLIIEGVFIAMLIQRFFGK